MRSCYLAWLTAQWSCIGSPPSQPEWEGSLCALLSCAGPAVRLALPWMCILTLTKTLCQQGDATRCLLGRLKVPLSGSVHSAPTPPPHERPCPGAERPPRGCSAPKSQPGRPAAPQHLPASPALDPSPALTQPLAAVVAYLKERKALIEAGRAEAQARTPRDDKPHPQPANLPARLVITRWTGRL